MLQPCPLKLISVFFALLAFMAESHAAETLNWNYPAANTDITNSSSSTVVNGVTITSTGSFTAGKFTTNSATIAPAGASNGSSTGIVQLAMNATIDDLTGHQTLTVRFSEPVYSVTFTILDIDGGPSTNILWNDIVELNSDAGRPTVAITNSSWVSYDGSTGRASAIANQNAASGNANQANGNITVTFNGPITWFTVRHYAAAVDDPGTGGNETDPAQQVIFIDDVTFKRSPRLTLQKTSSGGTGTFNFSISNGFSYTAPSSYSYGAVGTAVTTTSAGVAANGTSNILGIVNTATTVTETVPGGWLFTSATVTCTDSNTVDSGNPTSFSAPASSPAFTIAAANIRAGAVLLCGVSNAAIAPGLSIVKTANTMGPVSNSQVIGYTYTVTNTGNVAVNNISVADVHNGYGTGPVPGSEVLVSDNGTAGDSTDSTVNGIWNTLGPGDVIRFTASYIVTQADIDYHQ
jgi:uncharacterized repeat protein (TIGR01451 family)